jgi:hypothetical protein
MSEDLTDQQINDMYDSVAAVVWSQMPKEARQEVIRGLDVNELDHVRSAVQNGRRVIRQSKQK